MNINQTSTTATAPTTAAKPLTIRGSNTAQAANTRIQFRYEFRRNGDTIKTQWADPVTAHERMSSRIGAFHAPGRVSGDIECNSDGSHGGVARNGGLLSRAVRAVNL